MYQVITNNFLSKTFELHCGKIQPQEAHLKDYALMIIVIIMNLKHYALIIIVMTMNLKQKHQ